jgi:TRAP-type mannitol/chloroaromatic compound transport system permease small subunit
MALIRFIEQLSLWAGRLAALLILPLVFAMVFEVISRYVFSAPTAWAFELAYMMMGTIFLLGLAYALSNGQHVNVDFLHDRLPRRVVGTIDAIGYALLTAMSIWMVIALSKYAMTAYSRGEGTGLSAWNPQVWPYRVIYVIGFVLFSLQTFAKTIENIMIAVTGSSGGAKR